MAVVWFTLSTQTTTPYKSGHLQASARFIPYLSARCWKIVCRSQLKMRLSVVFLLVLLAVSLTVTSGAEDTSQEPHLRVRRGFGCPFSRRYCHWHCRYELRRRGGYCAGRFRQTCVCIRR
ncbi:hypothetical protein V5799_017158 [Amblyomma americanum]|uniref:Invertebrate defensins family profile domain-containing protein n=1 Tax=Amblyomma americanum TaxID=6943 RepID=A0AAQ4F3L1_AMBAM